MGWEVESLRIPRRSLGSLLLEQRERVWESSADQGPPGPEGGLQSLCCGSQVLGKYLMNGHYKAKDFDSIWALVRASLVAQLVKNLPGMWETWVQCLGWEDSPGGGHGNPLHYFPGESPWTEEPGGLQPMGFQRVRHDWATKHSTQHKHLVRGLQGWGGALESHDFKPSDGRPGPGLWKESRCEWEVVL